MNKNFFPDEGSEGKKPDYKLSVAVSSRVLCDYSNRIFPVNFSDMIKRVKGLRILTYSHVMESKGSTLGEICNYFGSDFGCSVSKMGKCIIYVNDFIKNQGIIRFTIAHELGHFFMKHFFIHEEVGFGTSYFSDEIFEKEANSFARNILAPPAKIREVIECKPTSKSAAEAVSELFGISRQAAEIRLDMLEIDLRISDELCREGHSFGYLNEFRFLNGRICSVCNEWTVDGAYCSFCGLRINTKCCINFDENLIAKNDFYPQYCIMCGGIVKDGICKICGFPNVNICLNNKCLSKNFANAFFCTECGSKTLFSNFDALAE